MNPNSSLPGNKWSVLLLLAAVFSWVGGPLRAQYAGSQACIECHGAIYNTAVQTRHFQVNVGCESCHGPSAEHAANYSDPTVLPVVDQLGTVCGNCHTGAQHPYYTEWYGSRHRAVSVGCPTCHDPHAKHAWTNILSGARYTNQLRAVISSTNNYYQAGSYIGTTAINLCGQCHNYRGVSWTNTAAPPAGAQYNLLLGAVGELPAGGVHRRAAHAVLTNQCAYCHMATAPYQSTTHPAVTGHTFEVQLYNQCLGCHPLPQQLVQFVMGDITNRILSIKYELDQWGLTKAPLALRSKYGKRSWEYTTPGELSSGGGGPTAAEQATIPINIRKARFDLYLVQHDRSAGVHNGPYFVSLLNAAQSWVETELTR